MARHRVTIVGKDYPAMADLVRKYKVEVIRHTGKAVDAGKFQVHALVDDTQIPQLRNAGYQVQEHEDVDAAGKQRQAEVGRGNRYLKP
jgi:hypothetical protein